MPAIFTLDMVAFNFSRLSRIINRGLGKGGRVPGTQIVAARHARDVRPDSQPAASHPDTRFFQVRDVLALLTSSHGTATSVVSFVSNCDRLTIPKWLLNRRNFIATASAFAAAVKPETTIKNNESPQENFQALTAPVGSQEKSTTIEPTPRATPLHVQLGGHEEPPLFNQTLLPPQNTEGSRCSTSSRTGHIYCEGSVFPLEEVKDVGMGGDKGLGNGEIGSQKASQSFKLLLKNALAYSAHITSGPAASRLDALKLNATKSTKSEMVAMPSSSGLPSACESVLTTPSAPLNPPNAAVFDE
ncbi:hypothetical protein BDZ97DRAFT_1759360 [Flammula alnicola]|nr:hypothetical protein BDZ97DRAFT_1759360 [Flammula alnicola]